MNPVYADTEVMIRSLSPFDAIASSYDRIFTNSRIGLAQRRSVWLEMDLVFQPGDRVLEINCGTGTDALHLAERGIQVVGCDSSQEMLTVARSKLSAFRSPPLVEFRHLATERIGELEKEGPFDGVLSNFGGLNCVKTLRPVVRDLARLTKPGGKVLLGLFGRCCLWEIAWYLAHGDFAKAFRRFRRRGVPVKLGAPLSFAVFYRSVRSLRFILSPYFRLVRWKGVGIVVPPSYLESAAARFPLLLPMAATLDSRLSTCPGLRALSDHVLLTLERTDR